MGRWTGRRLNAVFVLPCADRRRPRGWASRGPGRRGWWDNLIGPGRPLDTDRLFVICPNLLGGCQGTDRPLEHRPARPDARTASTSRCSPCATSRRVHRRLLAHLGLERVALAIGGSLGGMQALQWALDSPAEVERAALICATAKLSAQNIAFSAVARSRSPATPSSTAAATSRAAGARTSAWRPPASSPTSPTCPRSRCAASSAGRGASTQPR